MPILCTISRTRLRQYILLITVGIWMWSGFEIKARSQTQPSLELNKFLKPCFEEKIEDLPPPPLSQTELSVPSLWLAKELYGQVTQRTASDSNQDEQLLETWFVENPEKIQINPQLAISDLVTLVVNSQKWQAEKYMGQYVFLNRLGTVTTTDYQYNIRVCNNQGSFLGSYSCQVLNAPTPVNCQVFIPSEGFRIRDFKDFKTEEP